MLTGSDPAGPGVVREMMRTMTHRGPDDDGIYESPQAVLGHRRLSIIDLSKGKQPIGNEDECIWVVFNGEIYNFVALRTDLIKRGHVFRTDTDTEVIVHLYEEYGDACVEKLRGMFAFAVWDNRARRLLLARDRVGIKPLYYSVTSARLIFASEIKAILSDKTVRREVDSEGMERFLTFMYVPGECTLLRDIRKLLPGHYLIAQDGRVQVNQYWDLEFGSRGTPRGIEADTAELEHLLQESIRDHMISDVPVGVLLSGGVDSTALLSFVAQEEGRQVDTFTVGFDDKTIADERPVARHVAQIFGTRHHETTFGAREFFDFLPRYVWHMEEPVCEPPAVALYCVSKLASGHVKVLLSGEGGDEAFAGYQNYRSIMWLERAKTAGWPVTVALAKGLGWFGRMCGVERAQRYSVLMSRPLEQYYYSRTANPLGGLRRLRVQGSGVSGRVSDGGLKLVKELFSRVRSEGTVNRMLYVDSKTWLPDDLLIKADKMTMANSVELRVPLLDDRILQFAARLPEARKVRRLTTKYLLKRAMRERVPKSVLNRRKTGFPVPYTAWFNGELKDSVSDILHDKRSTERGYFERGTVDGLLTEAAQKRGLGAEVFSILILELWFRQFVDRN
jgi:asparagine synthase (glutamine-hydrolysing)